MSSPPRRAAPAEDAQGLHDGPSKSQRKRDSTALQDLGEALVALTPERLAAIELPDPLREAIQEAQRISKFGALRRQLQYVGRLMREVDPAPIRAALDALSGHSRAHTAWLHRLERLRERLVDEDQGWDELAAAHAVDDLQRLRQLARNARLEREQGRPPRAFRELFQALRELIPEPRPEPAEPAARHE
jgi:ribosome-associated protein